MLKRIRLFLFRWLLPGLLAGVLPQQWFRLLRDNRFRISARYWPRALHISIASVANAAFHTIEKRQACADAVHLQPPIFIIGHYRSGTSLLQQLMLVDTQFTSPNTFQVFFPHTFRSTEPIFKKMLGLFLPSTRVYDNMSFRFDDPQEDEFALCVLTLKSHFLRYVFSQRWADYDRYLTFDDVLDSEIEQRKDALVAYLKKLDIGKTFVLKSPAHTGKIRFLIDLFPDARFVHIHRNPLVVFQSTKHMIRTSMPAGALQSWSHLDLDSAVIQSYRQMYDAFFRDRSLIPADQFHEVAFEDLETDPVRETERLYDALGLHGFRAHRSHLVNHVNSLAGYQKNAYPPLSIDLRARLLQVHHRNFEEWGYEATLPAS